MVSDNATRNIDSILMNIYKHGKYYNPAWNHYGQGAGVIVSCDRCHRAQLKICLGWDKYDMCLKCAEEMSFLTSRECPIVPKSHDDPRYHTFMEQNMYRTNIK